MRILLTFLSFLISSSLIGQTANSEEVVSFEILKQQFNYNNKYQIKSKKNNNWMLSSISEEENTSLFNYTSAIPSAYSYDELAIFCKLEVQLEQKTKIPIKFRLGEFNHIEKLEGKPYSPFLVR